MVLNTREADKDFNRNDIYAKKYINTGSFVISTDNDEHFFNHKKNLLEKNKKRIFQKILK